MTQKEYQDQENRIAENRRIKIEKMTNREIRRIKADQKRQLLQEATQKRQIEKEYYISFIGKTGTIQIDGLSINVIAQDVKQVFGQYRYLVSPISGSGTIWVYKITFI